MKVLREASPQALQHFTRFDQVDQLVGASEADADTGFMARLLALCSLPCTNPDALGPGLQDARHDVTRALEVMLHAVRGRGPERGFGPSR